MTPRAAPGPKQPRLSRTAIIDRALELADGEGIEAVSVRRLARELGVTPMALYWHFDDKTALLHALGDRLLADLDLELDADAPWLEQLRSLVLSLTSVLRAHPAAAPLIGSLPTTASENALAATEVALEILARGGFSPADSALITRQVVRTTTSMVVAEFDEMPAAGQQGGAEAKLRSLDPERFPRLVEAAGPLSSGEDPERFYELVVELILAGIETTAARRGQSG